MANKVTRINENKQVRKGDDGDIYATLAGTPQWATADETGLATQDYVDAKDTELKGYVDTKDTELKDYVDDVAEGLSDEIATIELTPGPAGADGTNGTNGVDGRGIVSMTNIDGNNTAEITYTDGSTAEITLPSGGGSSSGIQSVGPGIGIEVFGDPLNPTVGLDIGTQSTLASALPSEVVSPVALTGAYSDLSGAPDLAPVATSGQYFDLIGIPVLGTASAADVTDFATASQGALADTALQNITGLVSAGTNVTITGNGTIGSPYVVDAAGGGGGGSNYYAHTVVGTAAGAQYSTLDAAINAGAKDIYLQPGAYTLSVATIDVNMTLRGASAKDVTVTSSVALAINGAVYDVTLDMANPQGAQDISLSGELDRVTLKHTTGSTSLVFLRVQNNAKIGDLSISNVIMSSLSNSPTTYAHLVYLNGSNNKIGDINISNITTSLANTVKLVATQSGSISNSSIGRIRVNSTITNTQAAPLGIVTPVDIANATTVGGIVIGSIEINLANGIAYNAMTLSNSTVGSIRIFSVGTVSVVAYGPLVNFQNSKVGSLVIDGVDGTPNSYTAPLIARPDATQSVLSVVTVGGGSTINSIVLNATAPSLTSSDGGSSGIIYFNGSGITVSSMKISGSYSATAVMTIQNVSKLAISNVVIPSLVMTAGFPALVYVGSASADVTINGVMATPTTTLAYAFVSSGLSRGVMHGWSVYNPVNASFTDTRIHMPTLNNENIMMRSSVMSPGTDTVAGTNSSSDVVTAS